jgi:hypothetical protein
VRACFTAAAMLAFACSLASLVACSLEERADFLIGRECSADDGCDEGQKCLPHAYFDGDFHDFRCRDRASFEPIEGREAPLAYCDAERDLICPAGLVCNADRVRQDAAIRRMVCKHPDDVFSPPLDGGT